MSVVDEVVLHAEVRTRNRQVEEGETNLTSRLAKPSKLLLHITFREASQPLEEGECRDAGDIELVGEEVS